MILFIVGVKRNYLAKVYHGKVLFFIVADEAIHQILLYLQFGEPIKRISLSNEEDLQESQFAYGALFPIIDQLNCPFLNKGICYCNLSWQLSTYSISTTFCA